MREDYTEVPNPPAPGFGDSIGAMTIAGGMMGALFHRERTGEATEVDVSLLGTGMWAMGQAYSLSLLLNMPWKPPPAATMRYNPLVRNYLTKDGHWLALCCLQAGKYWPLLAMPSGKPAAGVGSTICRPCGADVAQCRCDQHLDARPFAERTADEWREALADFTGQWTWFRDTLEAAAGSADCSQRLLQDVRDKSRYELPDGRRSRAIRRRGPCVAAPRARIQRAR